MDATLAERFFNGLTNNLVESRIKVHKLSGGTVDVWIRYRITQAIGNRIWAERAPAQDGMLNLAPEGRVPEKFKGVQFYVNDWRKPA